MLIAGAHQAELARGRQPSLIPELGGAARPDALEAYRDARSALVGQIGSSVR